MPDPNTDVVEPFTYRFDFHDDGHCYVELSDVLDEIPDELHHHFTPGMTPSDVVAAVEEILSDDDATMSAGTFKALDGMRDRHASCANFECDCAEHAWQSEEEFLNDELRRIQPKGTTWAVRVGGSDDDPAYDLCTVAGFYGKFARQSGWTSVTLKWDGTLVEATFCDQGACGYVEARPMSETASNVHSSWSEQYDNSGTFAWDLFDVDSGDLGAAHHLACQLDAVTDMTVDFAEVLAWVQKHGVPTDAFFETAVHLVESWEDSTHALLDFADGIETAPRARRAELISV